MDCMGSQLIGVLHCPADPRSRGLVIVVGGPQYRVGSHRQFLLMARHLSERGTPVLRFDYRGMGDSQGDPVSFEEINPDIRAAVDALFRRFQDLTHVVIWGLCDAASAAMMYGDQDSRVSGLVLANPWARTDEGLSKTYLKNYYKTQIFDAGFWKRLFTGQVKVTQGLFDFLQNFSRVLRAKLPSLLQRSKLNAQDIPDRVSYIEKMRLGLERFKGRVLLIMSGDDLTAAEFDVCVSASSQWAALMRRSLVQRRDFPAANHTFSRQEWRDQVAAWTDEWLRSW